MLVHNLHISEEEVAKQEITDLRMAVQNLETEMKEMKEQHFGGIAHNLFLIKYLSFRC